MPFFPPNPGRRPFPPNYRQRFGPPPPNQFMGRQPNRFGPRMQNQQMPPSGQGGLFNNIKTVMGHMGTVNTGINMLRQFGSVFSFFK